MAQLVGAVCVSCGVRLTNELDAAFCPVCGQTVHIACKRPPATAVADRCTAWGAAFDAAARTRLAAERAEAERARNPKPLDLIGIARQTQRLYRLGRFLLVGILLIGLGVLMVADPDFRTDPRRISAVDVVYGGRLVAAGLAVGLIGWWLYQNARRSSRH